MIDTTLERLTLAKIRKDGRVAELPTLPPELVDVTMATAALYRVVGFKEPWIGYVGVLDGVAVGTCAFKGPPRQGLVEIAYFTFPGYEGRGIATIMARRLIAIARKVVKPPTIGAQTLPLENASTKVLRKLGFAHTGVTQHPEDGTIWDWTLPAT